MLAEGIKNFKNSTLKKIESIRKNLKKILKIKNSEKKFFEIFQNSKRIFYNDDILQFKYMNKCWEEYSKRKISEKDIKDTSKISTL